MLLHHALLGLSVAALGAASLRAASPASPSGLGRIVAAAPIAATAAAAQALALGLVGLSGSPLALAAGALLAWVAARALLPAPALPATTELVSWWRTSTPGSHALTGALAGAGLTLIAWLLRHPLVGEDGVTYHVPIAATWVQDGRAGSVVEVFYGLPAGNYPLTHELLLAWPMAISQSLVAVTLLTPLLCALMAASAWVGLRALAVPRSAAAFATAGLCALPLVVEHLNEPSTDIAAAAWLTCGAALCAGSARRRALLGPAILALGLAVGTKATVIPLAAIVLAGALYAGRGELRRLAIPLGLAALGAVVVGGVWYVRNLVDHGSPLWPFVSLPWGDPRPRLLDLLRYSLLDRPRLTLEGHLGDYAELLAGAMVLVVGALVAPLLARRRAVAGAAGATVLALLLWVNAPLTGRGDIPVLDGLALTTTRYLLPAIAAAALALALAARERTAGGWIALALLAAALLWSVLENLDLGPPLTPSAALVALGAAVGAAIGWAGGWVGGRLAGRPSDPRAAGQAPPRRPWLAGLAPAAATVIAAALLTLPASGYVRRHAATWVHPISQVTGWFVSRPEFAQSRRPIAMAVNLDGVLVGDRLQHRVELIGASEPCPAVRARLGRGWVVTTVFPRLPVRGSPGEPFPELGSAPGCLRGRVPAFASPPSSIYADPRGRVGDDNPMRNRIGG